MKKKSEAFFIQLNQKIFWKSLGLCKVDYDKKRIIACYDHKHGKKIK